MKVKTAVTSLKVEKGCVNIDCNYCVENKKCYLQQLIEENEKYKQYLLNIAMIIEALEQQYDDIKDFTEIKEIKEILKEV